MYDEPMSYSEEVAAPNMSMKGGVVGKKLPSVTTALGKQDRVINMLNETIGVLEQRLQPVLNLSENSQAIDQGLKQAASGPAMFEAIELHNNRIAGLDQMLRRIINQLEI